MLRLDNITVKIATLLFLPAYFLFLNSSMRSYHSHIFASGIVITHSHPACNDNDTVPGTENKSGERQIIVFHGLMVHSPEEAQSFVVDQPPRFLYSVLLLPSEKATMPGISKLKMKRAPPALI